MTPSGGGAQGLLSAMGGRVMPTLDIAEADGVIEVTAKIPGVSEDDLDISITNDVLTIKGEKRSRHEEKERWPQPSRMAF